MANPKDDPKNEQRLETLRQLWAHVLRLEAEEIADGDSFFELGGDSIRAIQLLGLASKHGIDIDLDTFHQDSTLQSFSQFTSNSKTLDDVKHRNGHTTAERKLVSANPGVHSTELANACERLGLAAEAIVKIAPITPTQEMLLQLSLGGGICLTTCTFEVEGEDLDSSLLQLSRLLEAKIPIFRTTIVEAGDDKRRVQLLLKNGNAPWIRGTDLDAYLHSTMTQKMALGGSPVQYALIRDNKAHAGKTFFVLSIHHIFFDGLSRFFTEKDILQILESPTQYAQEPERPWYGDFALHMRALPNYEARASQYWSTYLQGAKFSNIHPQSQASPSGLQDGLIGWSQLEATNSASVQQTPLILAAWTLALARQSGLRDIVFGLARHGRSDPHQDIRRMVGPLLTFTPLRLRLGGDGGDGRAGKDPETVCELAQRVQREILTTAQWEQGVTTGVYPDAKGGPWVQSLVNLKSELIAMPPSGYVSKDGSGKIARCISRRDLQPYDMKSHWALILLIMQKKDTVEACMGYRSSLIGHQKAESLFGDFKQLVKELASGDSNAVDALLVKAT